MARILVVDDNADVLAAIERSLRDHGHEVTSTNSGADAICLLHAKPAPNLVLLDLGMPGLDGYAVLDTLGPTAPPVVVISGEGADALAGDPSKAGKVSRVLLKPFDQEQLLSTVAAALVPKTT